MNAVQQRTRFAEVLRIFYRGQITNDDFEEAIYELAKDNIAVEQVFWEGAWTTYSDNKCYKLNGPNAIDREGKKVVALWILFLKSKQEYKWPRIKKLNPWIAFINLFIGIPIGLYFRSWSLLFVGLFLLLIVDNIQKRVFYRFFSRSGDINYWPFLNQNEYLKALDSPPYLAGRRF